MFARRMLGVATILIASSALASQPLETETARVIGAGVIKIEGTAEFQTSKEGTERAFPLVFEYGLGHNTEIAFEPVLGVSINPKNGQKATGVGDVEMTITHLFVPETASLPAIAGAFEVKFPTAKNRLIGTGKTDFAAIAIASKRFDRLDLHLNLGYTVLGKPPGVRLHNIVTFAVGEEFHLSPQFDIVGEILGNTSATGEKVEGATAPGTRPSEVTGPERSAMIGMRYIIKPGLFLSAGVSYDNNHAWLIRPGITYRFGGR